MKVSRILHQQVGQLKWHLLICIALICIFYQIKLVLYDEREGSPTRGELQEIFLGEDSYSLVKIPPLVWNGFKGVGVNPAIVANCATLPHDPAEIVRLDPLDNRIHVIGYVLSTSYQCYTLM